MRVFKLDLALVNREFYNIVSQWMQTMLTAKDSWLDPHLVIVEELLKEASF